MKKIIYYNPDCLAFYFILNYLFFITAFFGNLLTSSPNCIKYLSFTPKSLKDLVDISASCKIFLAFSLSSDVMEFASKSPEVAL
jgi:hypothetical protein